MNNKSKYQIALDNIWLDINEGVIYSTDLERLMKDLKTLGELVDKATPKKPNPLFIPLTFMPYRCLGCGTIVSSEKRRFNYCPCCGQKILWERR